MAQTLHTDIGNFRSFKVLIAAEYAGANVKVAELKAGDNESPEFLAKSPLGKVPVLETSAGNLTESNAIAKYFARMAASKDLCGSSFFQAAQVDSWIDFCSHDLELPVSMWYYPIMGLIPADAGIAKKAEGDVTRALNVLEAHLSDKTYLVGHGITLADITIASTLVYPFKFVADAKYRAAFPNVIRWFNTCVNQKEFLVVIGSVVMCEKAVAVGEGAPLSGGKAGAKKEKAAKAPKEKKEEKPKEKKEKAKPKEEEQDALPEGMMDDSPPPAPKEEHIFKIMDKDAKSPFVMDTWKKTYSNEDYGTSMAYLWENMDWEGWSWWRGDYKYNEECKVLFMTSNLIGGFMQRTDEIRKWFFGAHGIRGAEEGTSDMKVTCYYLIRGQSIEPLVKCNDDAECYNWTMVGGKGLEISAQHKANIVEYLTSETTLEGEVLLDSRLFK